VEEADVLLWRPAPSTLFLGGWPTTTVPLYAGTAKVGLLSVGGSVGGTRSSALIFLLSMKACRADVDVVPPLTRNGS
jgi:hypothetical protein